VLPADYELYGEPATGPARHDSGAPPARSGEYELRFAANDAANYAALTWLGAALTVRDDGFLKGLCG
jgi:hypothetical protein